MRILAPLIIFVYNRVKLTQQMLEKINENELANQTEVYIFSDGPRTTEDADKVAAVRECIRDFAKENNFKEVHVIEAERNKGLANSIIYGVSSVIQKHKKVIVLEDDLLTDVCFLKFMNDCLDFYEDNEKIWSIGGTTYDIPALSKYKDDVYACYRGESCGWATWKNRWDKVDWEVKDYYDFLKDRRRKKLFRRGGHDMVEALKRQMEGKTDSWAIRWCYQQSKEDMLTILPRRTLTENIGWDGSGVHCSDVNILPTKLEKSEFRYVLKNVDVDRRIMSDFRKKFSRPLVNRILDYVYIKLRG